MLVAGLQSLYVLLHWCQKGCILPAAPGCRKIVSYWKFYNFQACPQAAKIRKTQKNLSRKQTTSVIACVLQRSIYQNLFFRFAGVRILDPDISATSDMEAHLTKKSQFSEIFQNRVPKSLRNRCKSDSGTPCVLPAAPMLHQDACKAPKRSPGVPKSKHHASPERPVAQECFRLFCFYSTH